MYGNSSKVRGNLTEPNVAILIDYENVGLDSIQYLLDQISDVGRITIKRAYADWSTQRNRRDQLLELGIEAIHHFRSTKSGKNSSDIRLVIDAIDLRHTSDVDTFVIASSDSDFVPLVMYLRAAGKSVMAAGRREITSETLVKSCDRYIFLSDAKTPPPDQNQPDQNQQPVVSSHRSLVARAVESSADENGHVVGAKLFQTMRRIDPSFNFKTLGYRTFGQFLQDAQEVRVTQNQGEDVVVQLSQIGNQDKDSELTLDQEREIDAAWEKRGGEKISSQGAAADVVRVFGVTSLKSAGFKSIEKLLYASRLLKARWKRDGNAVHRR
tara:strand:- start:10592 stop:11566 length:975 start_codon:yes stop_codon:yes gene_type:complete